MKNHPKFEKPLPPTSAASKTYTHLFPGLPQPAHFREFAHTLKNIGGIPPESESQANLRSQTGKFQWSIVRSVVVLLAFGAAAVGAARGQKAQRVRRQSMRQRLAGMFVAAMLFLCGSVSAQDTAKKVTAQEVVDAIK